VGDERRGVARGAWRPPLAVVPGFVGARSVKWLERIELRDQPWDGFFQSTAYRPLTPEAEAAPGAGIPLGDVALNSDILAPADGGHVAAGVLEV
jgi:sulfite oxidase